MNYDELIQKSNAESVKLYLKRQQLEMQKLQLHQEITLTDQRLLQLDGEVNILTILKREEGKNVE